MHLFSCSVKKNLGPLNIFPLIAGMMFSLVSRCNGKGIAERILLSCPGVLAQRIPTMCVQLLQHQAPVVFAGCLELSSCHAHGFCHMGIFSSTRLPRHSQLSLCSAPIAPSTQQHLAANSPPGTSLWKFHSRGPLPTKTPPHE